MRSTFIKAGTAGAALLLAPLSAAAADMGGPGGSGPYYQSAPSYKAPSSRGAFKAPSYKGVQPSAIAYYNWTGFYVGAVGGYGWGRSHWDGPGLTAHPRGWNIGGTLGYNLQFGSTVFGLETDLAWANVRGSTSIGAATLTTENNWLGTTRARIGYAFDRFLPYFTGGLAYGGVKAEIEPLGLADRKTKLGWVLGGGVEYGFLGNWTVKAEYLYTSLGSFEPAFPAPLATRVNFSEHLVRVGLNYRFSSPVYSRF